MREPGGVLVKKTTKKPTESKTGKKSIRDLDSKKQVKGGAAKKTAADTVDHF